MTATLPTDVKVARPTWDENRHPRDSKGRFIETGAEVRIFGGWIGKVLRNVGGGNIEVQRSDGKSVVVNRNYLTVTKRPDGRPPTSDEHEVTDIEEGAASPDAEKIDPGSDVVTPTAGLQDATEALDQQLVGAGSGGGGLEAHSKPIADARDAYVQAVNNGVPNDEADERAKLLDTLDAIDHDQMSDPQYEGSDLHKAVDAVRQAATQEPEETLPGTVTNPAPNSRHLVSEVNPNHTGSIPDAHGNDTPVAVGDSLRDQSGRTGWVVGFTDTGGPIMRDQNGNDWPYKDDALAQGHVTLTGKDDPSVKPMPDFGDVGPVTVQPAVEPNEGYPIHDPNQPTAPDQPAAEPPTPDQPAEPPAEPPAPEPPVQPAPPEPPTPDQPETPAATERVTPDQLAKGDRIHLTYGGGMATVESVDPAPRGGYRVTLQRDAGGDPMVLTMRTRDTAERDVRTDQPEAPPETPPEETGRADAQRTATELAAGDRVMVDGKPAAITANAPGREHGTNRAISGTFDDGQPLNREFPGDTRFDPAPARQDAQQGQPPAPPEDQPPAIEKDSVALSDLLDSGAGGGRDKGQWYRLDWNSDRDDPDGHYAMNPARGRPIQLRAVNGGAGRTTTPGPNDLVAHFTTDDGTIGELELPPTARLVKIDAPDNVGPSGKVESGAGDYDGPLYLLGHNGFPEGDYLATGDDGGEYDVHVDGRGATTVTEAASPDGPHPDDQTQREADIVAGANPGSEERVRAAAERIAARRAAEAGNQPADTDSIESQPPDPITLPYMRNPQSLAGNQARDQNFGQDTEPAGRYITENPPGSNVPDGWQSGNVHFEHPLHMDFGGGYTEDDNWKRRLSAHYDGKTGTDLSDAVRADGYDGIITHDRYGTSEIVDLTNGEGDRAAAAAVGGAEAPSPATEPPTDQPPDEPAADDPGTPPEGVRNLTWNLLTPEQRQRVRDAVAGGADGLQAIRDVRVADAPDPGDPTPEKPYVPPIARFGRDQAGPEAEGWTFTEPTVADLAVNQHVVVHSRGQYREARITSIGRTNVTVEYTTEGAVEEQRRQVEYLRAQDPAEHRATAERNAGSTYDYYQGIIDGSWFEQQVAENPPGTRMHTWYTEQYAEGAPARLAREAEGRKWMDESAPDGRDAFVQAKGQHAFDEMTRRRDEARASTEQDLYVHAHRTTKTVKASSVGVKTDTTVPGQAPEPGPPPTAELPTLDSVRASIRQTFADGGYTQDHFNALSDALDDPRTTIRPDGLIIHPWNGTEQWSVSSPDGMRSIYRAEDEDGANRLADAFGRVAAVDENGVKTDQSFDWITPGVQARIQDYNDAVEGTDNPALGRIIRNIVGATDRGTRNNDDWPDPVEEEEDPWEEYESNDSDYAGEAEGLGMTTDQIRNMFTHTHEGSGWYTDFSANQDINGFYGQAGMNSMYPGGIVMGGAIRNTDGVQVGTVIRSVFRNNDGLIEAHHDLLRIDGDYQGQGFADDYYKHLYRGYEANGVDVVTIQANINIGGYAWAQRGFDWDPDNDPENSVRTYARHNLNEALARPDLTDAQKTRIRAFQNFMADGEYQDYTPEQIANALRDIEWTETTNNGLVVKMWPGKKALLGSNWNGKFYVNGQARPTGDLENALGVGTDSDLPGSEGVTVPDTPVHGLSDDELSAEASSNADLLNRLVGVQRLGLADPTVAALVERQTTVGTERQRRITATMDRLMPGGTDVPSADLQPGDQVVVPIVTRAGPSIVTVQSVEERDDGGYVVTVEADDGSVTPVYMLGPLTDATWRRGKPVPTTASARLLVDGDNIILDDGTVAHIDSIEDTDETRILSLSTDTGPLEYEVSRDAVMTIHPGGATSDPIAGPDPLPPYVDPEAMTDGDLDSEFEEILSAHPDSIMADSTRERLDALRAERNRRAAARTIEAPPVTAEEKGTNARPRLYTYQRQAINALGIDAVNNTHDPVAKDAAARVRARQPLTHAHSVALANTIRQMNDGNMHHLTFGTRNTRKYERLAHAFDVSAAVAIGRQDPEFQPIQPNVTPWKPTGFTEGDQIVLRSRSGSLDSFKVRAAQTMMRGTLVRMELEDHQGNVVTRLVDRDNDAWLMPDLPEPEVVSPTAEIDNTPTRELARVEDLNVGDTVAWSQTIYGGTTSPSGMIQSIVYDDDGDPIFHTEHGDFPARVGTLVTREARGQASHGQPVIQAFRSTAGEGMFSQGDTIKGSEVQVGDFIQEPGQGRARGTVIGIDQIESTATMTDGSTRTRTTPYARIMQPDGTVSRVALVNRGEDADITREATAADNLSQATIDQFHAQHEAQVANTFRGYTQSVQNRAQTVAQEILAQHASRTTVSQSPLTIVTGALANNDRNFQNRSTAQRIAKELALLDGTDEYDDRVADGLQAAITQLSHDRITALYHSLSDAPLNGESRDEADARILNQWASNPPRRDSAAIGAALRAAVPQLRGTPPESDDRPVYDKSTLAGRMKAYRARIGGGSGVFGHSATRRTKFGTLDFDALEKGETPDLVVDEQTERLRAPDGGPSQQAMDDLATVRSAGQELDDAMQSRINEIIRANMPEVPGMAPIADGETVDQYDHRVRGRVSELTDQETDLQRAVFEARDAEADKWIAANTEFADRTALSRRSEIARGNNDWQGYREYSALDQQAQSAAFDTPAYTEAKQTLQDARDANSKARQVQGELRRAINDAQRQAAVETLAGLRGMGGTRLDYVQADARRRSRYGSSSSSRAGNALTERHRLVQSMRQAEDVYPTDWLNHIRDDLPGRYGGRTAIGLAQVTRGHADYSGNIRLSSSDFRVTADSTGFGGVGTHELGHFAQRAVPGLLAAEEAFLWSRTSTGEVGSRERTAVARGRAMSGDSSQSGYPDEFPQAYTGVDYARSRGGGGEAWEVLTTGMESLMNGSPYLDQDFRRWLLGTLALV